MSSNMMSMIIKEYFNIISPLLAFEECEINCEAENQVLALLCEVKKCNELFDGCRLLIDRAKCLQVYSDGSMLGEADTAQLGVIYDIKMEVLTECGIDRLRKFDECIFIDELKADANLGDSNSCKLLAFLNWMGLIVPKNQVSAQNLWSVLAMNGDRLSIEMLIYSYESAGDAGQTEKWTHIHNILLAEYEAFSAIALYSDYEDCTEEEVQIANLIMLISQKNSLKGTAKVNRSMIHYMLNSKSDYRTKMDKLSSETNYYLAMHIEDKCCERRCGF